jgi:DNA polymerase I-like protein with 3'-5' exonuclease and polymerase domains
MHTASLFRDKRFFHATLQDFHKINLILQNKWPLSLPQWSAEPPTQWPSYAAFDTEYIPDINKLIRWSLCDTDNNLYCVEFDTYNVDFIPVRQNSTVLIQNALADINYLSHIIDISTINIEDMMLAHSVLWTGEPHSLNYINSMYGAFNRYKHLAQEGGQQQLYSALDAYEPMYSWRHHFIPEFKKDKQSWQIYKKYRLPLINIINKAQQTGVKVNTDMLLQVQSILQTRLSDIQREACEITGDDSFNIGGSKQLKELIYE